MKCLVNWIPLRLGVRVSKLRVVQEILHYPGTQLAWRNQVAKEAARCITSEISQLREVGVFALRNITCEGRRKHGTLHRWISGGSAIRILATSLAVHACNVGVTEKENMRLLWIQTLKTNEIWMYHDICRGENRCGWMCAYGTSCVWICFVMFYYKTTQIWRVSNQRHISEAL